jgi:APA family basic amino acid/polyamine antiporter
MIMAGPRIMKSMGEDLPLLSFLAKTNKNQVPYVAVISQSIITIGLIISGKFESVLTFVGFSLSIFTFLTVSSIFILRHKKAQNTDYKTWGYPVTPIIFLSLNAFIIFFVLREKTTESLLGLLNLAIGGVVYLIGLKYSKYKLQTEHTINEL